MAENDRKNRAIMALLLGKSLEDVATEANISLSTLYRWRQDQDFQNQLEATRREMYLASIARVQTKQDELLTMAFELAANARSEAVKASVIRMLLEHAKDTYEWRDIAARIDAIERARANEPQS